MQIPSTLTGSQIVSLLRAGADSAHCGIVVNVWKSGDKHRVYVNDLAGRGMLYIDVKTGSVMILQGNYATTWTKWVNEVINASDAAAIANEVAATPAAAPSAVKAVAPRRTEWSPARSRAYADLMSEGNATRYDRAY